LILLLTLGFLILAAAGRLDAKEMESVSNFPSNPIKIIVPGSAGGVNHRGVIVIAPAWEKYLRTRFIIENVPGADGILAYNKAFKSPPNGYSLLSINFLSPVVLEVTRKTDYRAKEFAYVGGWNINKFIIGVHPDNWKTFKEFISMAKKKTVTISYQGGSANMQIRLLEDAFGVKFKDIPYNSGQEALTAVAGKHVDAVMTFSVPAMPMVKGEKLNALAVFSDKRDAILPNVPTFQELGYGNVISLDISGGFAAPPKTPEKIIKILEGSLKKITEDPEFIKLAEKIGIIVNFQPAAKVNKVVVDYYNIFDKYKDIFK
jgi:tripartite-type tricarboxylate transporter receptor subunit TctC